MTIELRFLPEADADLRRIHRFLADIDSPAATKAIDAIFETIDLLRTQPEMGRPFKGHSELRQWTVLFGNNGYVLQYGFENDRLTITRIWHSREERP